MFSASLGLTFIIDFLTLFFFCFSHPLAVMFFAHELHPYGSLERRAEFWGAIAMTFCGAGVLLLFSDQPHYVRFFLSILLVSVPTALYRRMMGLLFTAPCLLRDKSQSGDVKNCVFDSIEWALSEFAFILTFALGFVLCIIGAFFWRENSRLSGVFYWLGGVTQTWFYWFAVMLVFDFNPFPWTRRVFWVMIFKTWPPFLVIVKEYYLRKPSFASRCLLASSRGLLSGLSTGAQQSDRVFLIWAC